MAAPLMHRYMATHPVILGLVKIFVLLFNQLPIVKAAPTDTLLLSRIPEPPVPPDEPGLWLYLGIAAALVLSGGAFAGLTIALMGQVCCTTKLAAFLFGSPPADARFFFFFFLG